MPNCLYNIIYTITIKGDKNYFRINSYITFYLYRNKYIFIYIK